MVCDYLEVCILRKENQIITSGISWLSLHMLLGSKKTLCKGKDKAVPQQSRCGPEGSRRFRLPNFRDIRYMKVVKLSASRTGRLYPQKMFLVLIFTRGWVDPRPMVRSEGNLLLKNPVTPPGIDRGTVRLLAQRLNHYATPKESSMGDRISRIFLYSSILISVISSENHSVLIRDFDVSSKR